jgi:Calcineurin-like phosphoesterase.
MANFSDTIESVHHRVAADEWDRIFIVGDPHGCRAELETLCEKLEISETDLVIFVGDLVRKGPDSKGVVDLVRNAPNMLTVRGNNEEKLLRGSKSLPELTEDDLNWIASLPVVITLPDTLVVHGGIDPQKPHFNHDIDDLQNTRSLVPGGSYDPPYWFEEYEGPERVFFGHTVLEQPIIREHAIGLDTGCVYGGDLTAYNWRTGVLTTVSSNETYVDRRDEKFSNRPIHRSRTSSTR